MIDLAQAPEGLIHKPDSFLPGQANMPRVPKDHSEKIRQQYARRGLMDLYFLCRSILGYDLLTPLTHAHLCKFIVECSAVRRMIQMPRTHFKTTIATIADAMRIAVGDPNVQILIVASSSTNAERFLAEITNHFRRNERFRWVYQECIPTDWSKVTNNRQELEIKRDSYSRDPTFDAIGARGAVESRHYHWIKCDDIIGLKERQSDVEMAATVEWSDGIDSLLISPEIHRVDYVGTRQSSNDVYAHKERHHAHGEEPVEVGPYVTRAGDMYKFNRGAEENGEPIFPFDGKGQVVITKKFLDNMKATNPTRYAAHYANNPRKSGLNIFQEEGERFWHFDSGKVIWEDPVDGNIDLGAPETFNLICFCDPAEARDRKKSARQALVLTGTKTHKGILRIAVLRTSIGHYPSSEVVDTIFEWDAELPIQYFAIEKYGFQGALERWINQRSIRERVPLPPVRLWPPKGVHTAKQSKHERIRGLQPLWRAGQIALHRSQHELIDEILDYPNSRLKDGVDCLSFGTILWDYSWDEEEEKEQEKRERKRYENRDVTGYGMRQAS
jgi:hypothetical protein